MGRGRLFEAGYTRAMYTQCPHCLSVFVIEAVRLGAAHGHVRCGQCDALFDALPTLCDELPEEPYVTLHRQDGTAPPPQLDALMTPPELPAALAAAEVASASLPAATPAESEMPNTRAAPLPHASSAAEVEAWPDPVDFLRTGEDAPPATLPGDATSASGASPRHEPADRPEPAGATTDRVPVNAGAADAVPAVASDVPAVPGFDDGGVRHTDAHEDAAGARSAASVADTPGFARRSRPGRRWPWLLLTLLLTLALLAQLAWIGRDALVRNTTTRPWLQAACRILGVPTPQVRDLALLQLGARDIRPHPDVPGALLISATLINHASWTQPYPLLEVRLSDLAGKPVAERVFPPAAYLANRTIAARGLPAGASAAISIEVRDPGRRAVAFEIRPR